MRERSSRLNSSDNHQQSNSDDWVNGSWTVDCPCGVNFDDGEEMVDCDVCGVWVHTRCSGYDKGEKMFTCDNCKTNRNGGSNEEETEVAQLLVELPTKTVRMESKGSGVIGDGAGGSRKRQYRLWTDIPMEKRVHVQGVPGGDDPGLFSGVSKVFSPQLWKNSGYVPKKFNFRYREFPCWNYDGDKGEVGAKEDVGVDSAGAGALFSFLKANGMCSSGAKLVGMGNGLERSVAKLNSGESVDEKEADMRKGEGLPYPAVSAPFGNGKQVEFCEVGGSKTFRADTQSANNLKLRDNANGEVAKALAVDKMDEKVKNRSAVSNQFPDGLSFDKSGPSLGDAPGKGSADNQATTLGSSVGPVQSVLEGDGKAVNDVGSREDFSNYPVKTPKGPANTASEVNWSKVILDIYNDRVAGSTDPCVRVETEPDHKSATVLPIQASPTSEEKNERSTFDHMSENHEVKDVSASCSQPSDPVLIEVGRNSEAATEYHIDTHYVSTRNFHKVKQDIGGSDSPLVVTKNVSEVPNNSGNCSALPMKPLPSVAKSSSSSSTSVISRSSTDDIAKPAGTDNPSPITSEQVTSKFNASNKKTSPGGLVSGEEMHDVSKGIVMSSGNATVNVKYTSKISQIYFSKRNISASKDSADLSSDKAPTHNAAVTFGSSDYSGSLKNQNESLLENKTSSLVLPERGEQIDRSETRPSSNRNQALVHPPASSNTSAALSDEELALLLHQELNSSSRVPRVRLAGSVPHLASSKTKSILVKRSSSSGGKDRNSFSRKRNKDMKYGSRNSHDVDDEVKRAKILITPSPDQRRHGKETLVKRDDDGSSTGVHALNESIPSSSNTANTGLSFSPEASDYNVLPIHNSPRRNIYNDSGRATVPIYRTLPGLISDILSRGNHMTYEELCNAVLPHWHNLRKENGERYAYPGPSQAVVDCLRNRNEWAQLVEHGPKTSSTKKRRMLDTVESDVDDDDMKDRTVELDGRSLESKREGFPKGKRKARRRRGLAFQGRGMRDVRKRQKAGMLSNDNDNGGSLPDSSEDGMFSEYDSQGSGGAQPVGSEALTSSG